MFDDFVPEPNTVTGAALAQAADFGSRGRDTADGAGPGAFQAVGGLPWSPCVVAAGASGARSDVAADGFALAGRRSSRGCLFPAPAKVVRGRAFAP